MTKILNYKNILISCVLLLCAIISSNTYAAVIDAQNEKVLGQQSADKKETDSSQADKNESPSAENIKKKQDAQALFETSLELMLPINQDQIKQFRDFSDSRDRALIPVSPTLKSRTVSITLEPGHSPVKVLTTANVATSLVFHDSTGQPWPITSVTNGGPSFFQVLRPELPEGNLLNVMPLKSYGSSTIVVTLAEKDIPLIISMEADSVRASSRKADSLVLFQISHYGPNAHIPIIKSIKETTNSEMLAFLDRVPPSGSSKVYFEPKNEKLEVWKHNNKYFIRTSNELIWPAWISVVNGAGSIKCYEAPITPRILISKDGSIFALVLKEKGLNR